jgi:hypothetical protein
MRGQECKRIYMYSTPARARSTSSLSSCHSDAVLQGLPTTLQGLWVSAKANEGSTACLLQQQVPMSF